ncbi:MAG TPA: WG repeat-containing protein, partial [Planctomycetota bacterium]|nr:WG repeat-containing protein [Planctomycetota bacterium]
MSTFDTPALGPGLLAQVDPERRLEPRPKWRGWAPSNGSRKALAALVLLVACLGCGETVEPTETTSPAPPAKRVPFQKDRKWGFTDGAGHVVIAPAYDGVSEFSEGLAAVNVGGTRWWPGPLEGGKWGYVDEKGTLVIPTRWTHAQPFSEGLALVIDGHDRCYIDRSGRTVIRLEDVRAAGSFREGLAPAYADRSLDGLG